MTSKYGNILCSSAREDPPLTLIEQTDHVMQRSGYSIEPSQAHRFPWRGTLRQALKGNGLLPLEGSANELSK